MKRPGARPSRNLAIVLAFTASAAGTACTATLDGDDLVDGVAGSGALSGSGGTAGARTAGAGTGGGAGNNATAGSGAASPTATGGSATGGGGMPAGSGGTGGSGGGDAAGTGGSMSAGGSAGSVTGSAGSGVAGGAGAGEVPDEPYCTVTESWAPEHAALEEQIVVLVNQYRAEGASCGGEAMPPVGPLTMEPSLQCAARVHTKDMADRDFFDHDNPDGDGPSERMEDAGYDGRGWGENIAAGRETPEETMEQWMGSPGHCRNIMDKDYKLIGVGYYPGGEYRHLWTQTFGG